MLENVKPVGLAGAVVADFSVVLEFPTRSKAVTLAL